MTFEEFKAWHKMLGKYIEEIEASGHGTQEVDFYVYGEEDDTTLKLHEDSCTFDGVYIKQYNCGCWVGLDIYFDIEKES